MKVAYFALGEIYGSKHAGFVHTHNIVRSLSKHINIKLFIGGYGKADIPTTFISLPSHKNKNPITSFKSYKKIKNEITSFEIIHERFHINPVDLLFVKNKKYILEVNDPAPIIYSGIKGKIYSKIIEKKFIRADAIITQTHTMKKILSKFYNKKIFVVPNGVDIVFFEKNRKNFDIRNEYKIPKDTIIITFVGAFREWHGVHDIPEMAKKLEKMNVLFLVVGSGPLFKEVLKQKTENMLLTGSVSYNDIPTILSQSDILIAPFNTKRFKSLDEYGFYWCPVKLFEYMASGKPIVSYNFEEIRKITKNSAILAKPGDTDQFLNAIVKLINDKKLRKKLGKNGKKIAQRNYDWNNRAKNILEIYKEIL